MPRITRCRTRKRQPSRSDSSASCATSPFGGVGAISRTASERRTERHPVDRRTSGRRRPPRSAGRPIAGPTIAADVVVDRLERLRRGELLRPGRAPASSRAAPASRAPRARCRRRRARTAATPAGDGRKALTARRAATAMRPTSDQRTSFRRSSRSAIVPPTAEQHEQRDGVADREQPDLERRPGQLVQLEGHGDERDHAAQVRDRLAHPHEAGTRATRAAAGCRSRACAGARAGRGGRWSAAPPRGQGRTRPLRAREKPRRASRRRAWRSSRAAASRAGRGRRGRPCPGRPPRTAARRARAPRR